MALRFRRSIKLAPGVRVNLSGSGFSWSLGPRGASIGIGKRGTFFNTGIRGTGFYARQFLFSHSKGSTRQVEPTISVSMTVSVSDDGTIIFKDSNGNPASEALIEAAKKQQGNVIRATIEKACVDINSQVEGFEKLHLYTPSPIVAPRYEPKPFDMPRPKKPVLRTPGYFAKLFTQIKSQNAEIHASVLTHL